MPLHLLGKKSWNVYNATAIAKVRADESAAAAREEAQNERELAWQADVRLAQLRGLPAPARPAELDEDVVHQDDGKAGRIQRWEQAGEDGASSALRAEKRRLRRREGEDDTERDIRLAREDLGGANGKESAANRRGDGKSKNEEALLPLTDAGGHIQLFAPERPAPASTSSSGKPQREDPEQALRKRQQEEREAGSLRFSEAGPNRGHPSSRPWYAGAGVGAGTQDAEEVGRNAFGREDAGRKGRDAVRVSAADPMAVMMVAQRKLKEVERERERWRLEREKEVGLVRDYDIERGDRRHRHSGRDRDREVKDRSHSERRRRRHTSRSRSPDDGRRHRSHRHRD